MLTTARGRPLLPTAATLRSAARRRVRIPRSTGGEAGTGSMRRAGQEERRGPVEEEGRDGEGMAGGEGREEETGKGGRRWMRKRDTDGRGRGTR